MQKKRKDNQFIKKAFYEGGNKAFREFIYSNLKYPKEALAQKIEGIVHLRIDIDHKGKVTDVKVTKGIGYGCDEEAIRIMKMAEYAVTKGMRKMRVAFQKNIRIDFKLSMIRVKDEPAKNQIQYQVTKKKVTKSAKPKSGGSISYTIEY